MTDERLDELDETSFWLAQPDLRRDLQVAHAEMQNGDTVSGDELRAEFGLGD